LHVTYRAVEAFRVPVFVESLDPAIARLNGELAPIALGLEHLRPVCNGKGTGSSKGEGKDKGKG
jgi:hypothetical protein